jgi:hypothetical protein
LSRESLMELLSSSKGTAAQSAEKSLLSGLKTSFRGFKPQLSAYSMRSGAGSRAGDGLQKPPASAVGIGCDSFNASQR